MATGIEINLNELFKDAPLYGGVGPHGVAHLHKHGARQRKNAPTADGRSLGDGQAWCVTMCHSRLLNTPFSVVLSCSFPLPYNFRYDSESSSSAQDAGYSPTAWYHRVSMATRAA